MSLNAATIELLLSKGLSGEDLLEVARSLEKKRDNTNAERQARYRDRRKEAKASNARYSNGVTPPIDNTLTPTEPDEANASLVKRPRRKLPDWPCPEGVQETHWIDFLTNRKRKRCAETQTALDGILADIAKIADAEWPPGRLVQHAAAKGWASINDPRKGFSNDRTQQAQPASRNTAAFELAMRGVDPHAPF